MPVKNIILNYKPEKPNHFMKREKKMKVRLAYTELL